MYFPVRKGFAAISFLIGTIGITTMLFVAYKLLAQKNEALVYALYAKAEQSVVRSMTRIAQRQAALLTEKEKSLDLPIKELDGCVVCNATHCYAYRHKQLLITCKRQHVFRKDLMCNKKSVRGE